jgi:cold shock CspA family protein
MFREDNGYGKAFGFIRADDCGVDVYINANVATKAGISSADRGAVVQFEMRADDTGRRWTTSISRIEEVAA